MSFVLGLKVLVVSILFVLTGGAVFSEWGKQHRFLVFLSSIVAVLGTFYLFQEIYSDLKADMRAEVRAKLKETDDLPLRTGQEVEVRLLSREEAQEQRRILKAQEERRQKAAEEQRLAEKAARVEELRKKATSETSDIGIQSQNKQDQLRQSEWGRKRNVRKQKPTGAPSISYFPDRVISGPERRLKNDRRIKAKPVSKNSIGKDNSRLNRKGKKQSTVPSVKTFRVRSDGTLVVEEK